MRYPPAFKRLARYIASAVLFFFCLDLLSTTLIPKKVRIQHDFPKRSFAQPDRRDAVKKEFLHAWSGYQDHGWMADGLQPVTGLRKTQFCSWSATLVDSLDTLWIMGLHEEFEQAVNATLTIDFAHNANHCMVSLFESTIRYLGGLLGAYDVSNESRLLPKLVEVGDMLYSAFDTPNGLPCNFCHLASKTAIDHFEAGTAVSMADLGSLYLEFGRLSQTTGDNKYLAAVDRLAHVFRAHQMHSTIPGLWPETINARVDVNDSSFATRNHVYSLGALSDSSYEYLLKAHMLLGHTTSIYADMWQTASRAIRQTLLFRAMVPPPSPSSPTTPVRDILFSGSAARFPNAPDITLDPRAQHLACFAGGLFALASRVLPDSPSSSSLEFTHLEIGAQLTQGCIWAYQHSPTGIMPETLTLLPCPDLDATTQCPWNSTEWTLRQELQTASTPCDSLFCPPPLPSSNPEGFHSVPDPRYLLRPEAIESVFVLWRITGDEYYRDVGWDMFNAIVRHTRSAYGHSALQSVMEVEVREVVEGGRVVQRNRAPQADDMESFWFAETLKYFWLLFEDVEVIGLDDWVLNTEAHPLRLRDGDGLGKSGKGRGRAR